MRHDARGSAVCAAVRQARSVLKGKRVLVTGGAGFVGSHIVDLLVAAGAGEVVVVDDMVRGRPGNLARVLGRRNVRLIEGDIRDRGLMRSLVAGSDTVFHQAALRITHCAAEPRRAMEVMVDATYELVRLCVEEDVRKLVMASTASVYGMAESFPTREDHHPYGNRTLYGAAKIFAEGLMRSFNDVYGLDYVALRYFNVYGPRMDIHGRYTEVLVRWMDRIAAGLPPVIFGDGLQTMDMSATSPAPTSSPRRPTPPIRSSTSRAGRRPLFSISPRPSPASWAGRISCRSTNPSAASIPSRAASPTRRRPNGSSASAPR